MNEITYHLGYKVVNFTWNEKRMCYAILLDDGSVHEWVAFADNRPGQPSGNWNCVAPARFVSKPVIDNDL